MSYFSNGCFKSIILPPLTTFLETCKSPLLHSCVRFQDLDVANDEKENLQRCNYIWILLLLFLATTNLGVNDAVNKKEKGMIEFWNSNFSTVNKIHTNSQVSNELEEINHLYKNILRYDNYVKLIILVRMYDKYVVEMPWERIQRTSFFTKWHFQLNVLKTHHFEISGLKLRCTFYFLSFNCKICKQLSLGLYNCYYCLLWLQKGAACIKFYFEKNDQNQLDFNHKQMKQWLLPFKKSAKIYIKFIYNTV